MKQFQELSNGSAQSCAREILELIPHIMRTIRTQMRSRRKPDLNVPQFRSLAFLAHFPDASLSQLAEHLGLSLPSASKIVDALVARELIVRRASPSDRRRVRLRLSASGKSRFDAVREAMQDHLADALAAVPENERRTIVAAMRALRPVFVTPLHDS